MKKMYLLVLLGTFCMFGIARAQEKAYKTASGTLNVSKSKLAWENRRIDVGTIARDIPVEVDFYFTNEGDVPIVIENVRTSCGCTAAKHTDAPILSGETSKITVSYDARKPGVFRKSITIETSDDENPTMVMIAGEVK